MPNLSSEHIMGLCATVRERGRKAREAEVADLLNPLKRRIAELEAENRGTRRKTKDGAIIEDTNAEFYDRGNGSGETVVEQLMSAYNEAGKPPYLYVFAKWLLAKREGWEYDPSKEHSEEEKKGIPHGQGAEDAPPPADTADNGQAEELPPDNAEAAQGEDAGKGEELPPDTPPPGQGALDGAPPPPAAYEDDGKGKGKGNGNGKRGRPRK